MKTTQFQISRDFHCENFFEFFSMLVPDGSEIFKLKWQTKETNVIEN